MISVAAARGWQFWVNTNASTPGAIPELPEKTLEEEIRPGFYRDDQGEWKKDRRQAPDRRSRDHVYSHDDRRQLFRRKTDREIADRDAKQQIEEALEDFAAEHEGQG
ncbi:MAG: hypothetical protein JXR94_01795 [Candidatus Hydrogenedentes bacterium]|nr:hypothetical protein [Candidatus Hydrogenedentota bacterium]